MAKRPRKPLTEEQRVKARAAGLRYHYRNKEACNARALAWQKANPGKAVANTRRWQLANPDKVLIHRKNYQEANPEYVKSLARKRALSYYGLTVDGYAAILTSQGGGCAICKKAPTPNRRLAVDHCHNSDKVRGLLCINCNNGLGRFKDNPAALRVAAEYIEQYQ